MDIATLISYGTTLISLLTQAYKLEQEIQPELIESFEIWKALLEAWSNGTTITEDQVTALDSKIEVLSAANAEKEQAIISGTAT